MSIPEVRAAFREHAFWALCEEPGRHLDIGNRSHTYILEFHICRYSYEVCACNWCWCLHGCCLVKKCLRRLSVENNSRVQRHSTASRFRKIIYLQGKVRIWSRSSFAQAQCFKCLNPLLPHLRTSTEASSTTFAITFVGTFYSCTDT